MIISGWRPRQIGYTWVFVLIAGEEVGQRWRAMNTAVEHYRKGLKCERRVERERRIRELAPTKRRTWNHFLVTRVCVICCVFSDSLIFDFFFCSCCCLFLGEARARALRRFIPHPARGPHGPRLFFYLSLISNGIWHQAGSSSWICIFLLSLSLSLYLSLFFLASSSKLLKAFASSCCWITPLVSWLRSPTLNQSPKAETLIMGISILRGTKHIYTFLPFFFFVVCCCCWLDSFCSFSDEKHQDTLCVVWQNEI